MRDLLVGQLSRGAEPLADGRQLAFVFVDHPLRLLELRCRRGRLAHRGHRVERRLILFLQRAVLGDAPRDVVPTALLRLGRLRRLLELRSRGVALIRQRLELRLQLGELGFEVANGEVIVLQGQQCANVWVHESSKPAVGLS